MMLLTLSGARSASATGPAMVSAASDAHVWFVIEEQRTGSETLPRVYRLIHHAAAMQRPTYSTEATIPALSQYPEALAAWDAQLWIVNPVQPSQQSPRRDVFTVRVRYEPTFDIYQHEPHDRLQSVEPLPAHGRLAGFTALASGPVALFMPTERGLSGVVTSSGERPSEDELSTPRLMRLDGQRWIDIPLPDDFPVAASAWLAAARSGDGSLSILALPRVRRGEARVATLYRLVGEQWQSSSLTLGAGEMVRHVTSVLGSAAVVIEFSDGPTDLVRVDLLRSSGLATLAQVPAPNVPWTIEGLASDLRLFTRGTLNQVLMQRMDPLTGAVAPPEEFAANTPSLAVMVHMIIIVLVAALATGLAFSLMKWRTGTVLQLPEGWHVMSPFGRAMALAIDMVPAGLVTMLLLECSVIQLTQSPISVPKLELATPYLVMMGLTLLHSGAWELVHGTSLGKSLLGAKVTDMQGKPLSRRAILVRLAFKAAVLFVPLLAFPTIVNRWGQGLGERVVGAVVIGRNESEPSAE